jgi:hypothetical protein
MFAQAFAPRQATLFHNWERLQLKARIAPHSSDRHGDPGGSHIISLSIRFQDGGVQHRAGGSDCAYRSQSLRRQARVDTALFRSSGHIYSVPSDSVFPLTHLRTRHGDAGALRGFADHPWKIYQSVGA